MVSDLQEAIHTFHQKLGVRPVFGGHHKTFGTKNALINLSHKMYLELLAVDEDNTETPTPRWMGVDLLTKNQITRYALTSESLENDASTLKKHNPLMGEIQNGSRNSADGSLLQWDLIMPLSLPEVELVPFMVDWSKSEKHPSEILPAMGCELIALHGIHSNPEIFDHTFQELGFDLEIRKGMETNLRATLKCPKGILQI